MKRKSSRRVVFVLALLTVIAGYSAVVSPVLAAHSSDTPSEVEIYEHRTESGNGLHTIVLPSADIEKISASDNLLGVVVIPEQERVCQAVAEKGYEADSAGCMQDESRVETYLDAAGVERTASGNYTAG